MATERVWPDLAIPPGEFLAETLEELDMSQASLARQTGRPVQAINEIVHGKKAITPETALQFEQVLQVPAYIWTRLEADYQLTKARLARERLGRTATTAFGGHLEVVRPPRPMMTDTKKSVWAFKSLTTEAARRTMLRARAAKKKK